MFTLTMGENAFVLVDDPGAPSPREWAETYTSNQQSSSPRQKTQTVSASGEPGDGQAPQSVPSKEFKSPIKVPPQPHYHYTFVTLRPLNSLELLLPQLRARWTHARQAVQAQRGGLGKQTGQPLSIEGTIFALGKDWIVRVGNVNVSGGMKGMLLEVSLYALLHIPGRRLILAKAEYLPLPTLPTGEDHSSALVSNLLLSLLPMHADARTHSITLSDAQWKEVLHDTEAEAEESVANTRGNIPSRAGATQQPVDLNKINTWAVDQPASNRSDGAMALPEENEDDVFAYADDEGDDIADIKKGDWLGLERDRRSAFMIIMGLRSEGIV